MLPEWEEIPVNMLLENRGGWGEQEGGLGVARMPEGWAVREETFGNPLEGMNGKNRRASVYRLGVCPSPSLSSRAPVTSPSKVAVLPVDEGWEADHLGSLLVD